MSYEVMIDTFWVLFAAVLVFFMNLGFAAVESGMARAKNTVNILSKNFIVFAISSLGFLLLGWGLMFGGTHPLIGTENLWILGSTAPQVYENTLTPYVPFWGKVFFQLVFCGTAATIVSGAVAERIKYSSFIIFSFALTLVIYPIVGHWIWGGGWLAQLGFLDFAGDTVVHSVGGWAALAGAMILGPRIGKYDVNGKPRAIPGHNMSLAVIGLFVLWLGWFGFNPGSTMSFQNPADVVYILMTTNSAAIAAVLTSTICSWIIIKKADLTMTINGCLAGLVAITGGCAYVSLPVSLLIGAIAGVVVVLSVFFFDRIKIDDPVGATSVHLACGILGTLCVGLFAKEGVTSLSSVNGLFYGGGLHLLAVQIVGIAAVGVFVFLSTSGIWLLLKHTMGIRVSPEEEREGLDIGEHGNVAYPDFSPRTQMLIEEAGSSATVATESFSSSPSISPDEAIKVINQTTQDVKITKVTIITNPGQLSKLKTSLDSIGITGITVTNVMGYGMQKGYGTEVYRGIAVESKLIPKVQIDIVICKVPVPILVSAVKEALYTGHIGDGKIFISDVENVVKVRTGEEGYLALQDEA